MTKKKPSSLCQPNAGTMPVKHRLTKLFWVISPAFMRWAESHMHEKGLTPQRVRLMIPLIENGPMMMSELRDELGVSASNITALVDALEKDKMVTRKSHSSDRRATLIAITSKAEKQMTESCSVFRDRVAELFSGLSRKEEEQLLVLLLGVRQSLIKRNMLEECDLFHCTAEKKKRHNMYSVSRHILLATAATILLAGCAVGPDFAKPAAPDVKRYTNTDLPARTASTTGLAGAGQTFVNNKDIPEQWWKQFGSEPLNALVDKALLGNPDLRAANASLRVAQENFYAERGDLLPTIDVTGGPTREKFNPAAFGETGVSPTIFTLYNASVNISYGIDIFGGSHRAIEEALAVTNYQRYERQAAYLTLISNVVTASIQEASLSQQIKETQNIVDIETKQLDVLKKQLALGAVPKSTVLEQEATLAQTQTNLPPLEKQLAQQQNTLAVLAGEFPGNNPSVIFDLGNLKLPEELPLTLPSKLVEQRPDIRAAEEQLHQASAAIGVATAQMLPQINLTGSYGSESTATGKLFGPSAEVWSIGAGLTQPLFHGGELLHARRAAIATYDKAEAQYQSTVLLAFKNVADTLRALQYDADGLAAQVNAEAAAKNSLDLAQTQFGAGAISYPQLLDAERTYQQARIGLVQAQAARLADTVALFQALGGSMHDTDTASKKSPPTPSVGKKS